MPHPIHPVLVHFPIACWSLGSVADVAGIVMGKGVAEWAALLITAGLILAVPAIFTGLLDLGSAGKGDDEVNTAMSHITFVLITWSLYAASLYVRTALFTVSHYIPIALSLAGLISLGIAGWYGGRLVYTYGVGVNIK